jgi:hypothetical protein
MKTIVKLSLLCFCLLWSSLNVHASDFNLTTSVRNITKLYTDKNNNRHESAAFANVINVEDDFVFSAEDEDEEFENGKRLSIVKDVLALLCSFADLFTSCTKLHSHNIQTFPDNSPIYISQRVLRI